MKHTPGPWKIDMERTDNGAPVVVAKNGWTGRPRVIARVLFEGGSEDPEVHSNALLIAAAPDLLEACKDAAAHLQEILDDPTAKHLHPIHHCPTLDKIKLAIAKSEGVK